MLRRWHFDVLDTLRSQHQPRACHREQGTLGVGILKCLGKFQAFHFRYTHVANKHRRGKKPLALDYRSKRVLQESDKRV
jgi:hypothetical protein